MKQPSKFTTNGSHRSIFSLSRRSRNCGLFL
jgi:hypothetical protein